MADKSVGELIAAQSVTPTDLFVLEQNGTAKKLTGQILENWLVSFADGHGGIQSIVKNSTSGLVDTYRITLADTTTFDFMVTNGKGINSVSKVSTSGLVDTYRITFNDGTSSTFTVTNGEKGDKGDNQYVWIKYASQKPTASSHSFGDVADDWIGIYSGSYDTAPTDWTQYEWFKIKGEKGDTGAPAALVSSQITYQVGDSGTIIPSGSWSESIPPVPQGKYLWTREITQFNTGNPITKYSVSRFGIDGSGSVSTVAGVSPDADGNVPLIAKDVKALPVAGGTMEGSINMNGQSLSGLNTPTKDDEAATKGYADELIRTAAPRNLLDNSYFADPVNQRGVTSWTPSKSGYWSLDRWVTCGAGTTFTLENKKVVISNDGSATCGFQQRIEEIALSAGKRYTLAVKGRVTGTWYLSFGENVGSNTGSKELDQNVDKVHVFCFTLPESTDGLYNFRIRSSANVATAEIEWMALYEGEYTAETLPEYQPKGYCAEWLECKRYFIRFKPYEIVGNGIVGYGAGLDIIVPVSVPMRISPSYSGNMNASVVCKGQWLSLTTRMQSIIPSQRNLKLSWADGTFDSSYASYPCMLRTQEGGDFSLSADL